MLERIWLLSATLLLLVLPPRAPAFAAALEAGTARVVFSGKVVGPDGEPVGGATVEACYWTVLDNPSGRHALDGVAADEAGLFTYLMPRDGSTWPAVVSFLVRKEGLAVGWAQWSLAGDVEAAIRLQRPVAFAGTVVDEAGTGVPGAEVRALLLISDRADGSGHYAQAFGVPPFDGLATQTDAAGRFVFANIPAGSRAEFLVSAPGRATLITGEPLWEPADTTYRAPDEDIRIMLPREARIRGMLIDGETDDPVAGQPLEVGFWGPGGSFLRASCVSADDGRFDVGGLCAGIHSIRVRDPGDRTAEWVAGPTYVRVAAGRITNIAGIELSRGCLLTVRAEDAFSFAALGEVRIRLDGRRRGSWAAETDEDGICRFRVLPGEYRLGASVRGYEERAPESIEIGEEAQAEWVVGLTPLPPPPHVRGTVLDPSGQPVAGAELSIGLDGDPVRSDPTGAFEVQADWGRWSWRHTFHLVAVDARGHSGRVLELRPGAHTLEVRLLPTRTVLGRVVGEDGQPIEDVRLWITWRMTASARLWGEPLTTDARGRFQLPDVPVLPAGHSLAVSPTADGHGDGEAVVHVTHGSPEEIGIEDICLVRAEESVSGMVVDEAGHPVADALVWTAGQWQPGRTTRTDAEGRFRIDGLFEGKATVGVSSHTGMSAAVVVEAGADDVCLVRPSARWDAPPVPVLDSAESLP